MKTALVLEGGALRGIFTSGVIDYFLDNNIEFDYICGVSAGACNTLQYLGKEKKYMKRVLIASKNDPFFGVKELAETRHFVNLDKIFYDYADALKFNFDNVINSHTRWEMVATNMNTGKPEYFHSDDPDRIRLIGKASCSLPFLTNPVEIDGQFYMDGGVSDSIPLQRAIDLGYEHIVVIATRKKGNYSRVTEPQKLLFHRMYKDHPEFLKTALNRTEMYKSEVDLCEKLEEEGKIILIRPTMQEVSRLESDQDALSLSYYHGYTKARENLEKINEWINE